MALNRTSRLAESYPEVVLFQGIVEDREQLCGIRCGLWGRRQPSGLRSRGHFPWRHTRSIGRFRARRLPKTTEKIWNLDVPAMDSTRGTVRLGGEERFRNVRAQL